MAAEYRVLMNGRWDLEDLYVFPHAFAQTYSFVYCLDSPLDARDAERMQFALQTYPWRGGYSYVNIYKVLQSQVPRRDQPSISSINYGSPGWLDILLNAEVAVQVATSVAALSGAAMAAAEAYRPIYRVLADINSLRRRRELERTQLTTAHLTAILESSEVIAKHVGFSSLRELTETTGSPEITLRILLSHYRRLKIMEEFVRNDKAVLPTRPKEEA